MALQDLRHPYVCGYKEFFVTWDKEVLSIVILPNDRCDRLKWFRLRWLPKVSIMHNYIGLCLRKRRFFPCDLFSRNSQEEY